MNVDATVNFPNGSKLFLISDFFEPDLAKDIVQYFQTVDDLWQVTSEFEHYPGRLVYKGYDSTIDRIARYCTDAARWVGRQLGHQVRFKEFSLWLDQPGYYLPPHVDIGGVDHAVQIYFGNEITIDKKLGFGVYNDTKSPLFQLAYKPNSGYLLDNPTAVVHGMEEPIQAPHQRWSVYVRYFCV
jgi:hypothetical protein